jgi:hypothetical protein
MSQASFTLQGHNPDVLSCIANLSNDEVFTPPEFSNRLLDELEKAWALANNGKSIWEDKLVTFLDPCTKSGVFLREIVKRLTSGLSNEIPDLTERVNHILTKQVFGVGITELTSLLARRSLYCSKNANGIHSVARTFNTPEGNIWFKQIEHSWKGDRCQFCSANKSEYERTLDLETHAYAFIHTSNIQATIKSMFGEDMHFDVIIGNPPYQLSDGGFGTSAVPIYHKFVEQAKMLEPRYLSMVVPARWFAGGRGLDDFRESMLNDKRLRRIVDFPDSNDVFPGTQIKGGVCYFLWERDNEGLVEVTNNDKGVELSNVSRELLEPGADVFIRYNQGVSILRKVMAIESGEKNGVVSVSLPEKSQFTPLVSSLRPFGFRTFFQGKTKPGKGDLKVYQNGGVGYSPRRDVISGLDLIDCWKVFIPRAGSGSDAFPHPILGRPFIGAPEEICSETYLCIGPFSSENEAKNVISYLTTRLARFLVLLHKPSADATRAVYTFVPKLNFTSGWTDEMLYKKYGITVEEIAFIESMIRPMDLEND